MNRLLRVLGAVTLLGSSACDDAGGGGAYPQDHDLRGGARGPRELREGDGNDIYRMGAAGQGPSDVRRGDVYPPPSYDGPAGAQQPQGGGGGIAAPPPPANVAGPQGGVGGSGTEPQVGPRQPAGQYAPAQPQGRQGGGQQQGGAQGQPGGAQQQQGQQRGGQK
ncbi:MAG: hypothetical protein ACK4N5_27325 [Myxococcales bacterium]